MRSALKLVTVTPINSISASSNAHMASKVYQTLSIFLVHVVVNPSHVGGGVLTQKCPIKDLCRQSEVPQSIVFICIKVFNSFQRLRDFLHPSVPR